MAAGEGLELDKIGRRSLGSAGAHDLGGERGEIPRLHVSGGRRIRRGEIGAGVFFVNNGPTLSLKGITERGSSHGYHI